MTGLITRDLITDGSIGANGSIPVADANSSNGFLWTPSPARIPIRSGGHITNSIASTTASVATGSLIAFPVYVMRRNNFTAIAFAPTSATSITYKTGLYTDAGGVPGTLIANTEITSASTTVAAQTNVENAFSSAVNLAPGWYWMALSASGSSSMTCEGSISANYILGAPDALTGNSLRCFVSHTHGDPLPASFGSATFTSGSTPRMLLKVQ